MARVEVVEYRGIKFRRYPDSERWPDRVYFTPGIADRQRGVKRLHEEVWMAEHGPIPAGHHVHHADHDPLNNDPANLVCITGDEHREHHATDPESQARRRADDWLAHLDAIRPAASAWHGSAEGRRWHSEHGKQVAANRVKLPGLCEQCGDAFTSVQPERFCSNACKSAWRRSAGLDDVTRQCAHCGSDFTVNRYRKTRCCSRTCAQRLRAATT